MKIRDMRSSNQASKIKLGRKTCPRVGELDERMITTQLQLFCISAEEQASGLETQVLAFTGDAIGGGQRIKLGKRGQRRMKRA